MKLYMVTDSDRWGWSTSLVRAESPEQAQRLACPHSKRFEVEEIDDDGTAKLLWSHDESPDTGPEPCDCDD